MTQNRNVILVIGCQRTGSNFLLSVLRSIDGLGVYGEMFHRQGLFPFQKGAGNDEIVRWRIFDRICETVPGKLSELPPGPKAPDPETVAQLIAHRRDTAAPAPENPGQARNNLLIRFAHRFPAAFVRTLRDISEDDTIIFKVFPEHMDIAELNRLIRDVRPIVVFNLRDTIETYISFQKLKMTQTPQDHDTTAVKAEFKVVDYIQYVSGIRMFYFAARDLAGYYGLETFTASYQDIHQGDRSDLEKAQYLADRLGDWTGRAWTLDSSTLSPLRKQDQSKSNAEKVTNPEALPKAAAMIF